MKSPMSWKNSSVVFCLMLPLAGGCLQQPTLGETSAAAEGESPSPLAMQPASDEDAEVVEVNEEADVSTAAVKPITTEATVPQNIARSGPLAEMVKLAESGVDPSVLLSYV